jgi:glycerophosphoryl diester phosphodiesterase
VTTVIAHRGASGTAPENTLAAFELAERMGAHMIELDVQLAADGAVMVLHDDSVDRTTDGRGRLAAHTSAALRALDAGTWFAPEFAGERIPTLAEVLAAVSLPVNVELKQGGGRGLEDRALEAVRTAGALGRVVFSSFDHDALRRLRGLTADAEIAVLWNGRGAERPLSTARRVAARALHLRTTGASERVISAALQAGFEVRVWTVNDPEEWRVFAARGATAVFTDHPERFLHTPSC